MLNEVSSNDINKVKEFWDRQPCNIKHSNYEIGTSEYFKQVREKKLFVEPHILPFANFSKCTNKNVLEVGCGIGTAAYYFSKNEANYTGIDLSSKSVELTKQHLTYLPEQFNTNNIFEWNIETPLPEKYNQTFDLVYSFGVLHHTPNINLALDNIHKILKPDGELKIMLYAKNSWKNFMIEGNLDQYEAQSGCPIANVYTNDEVIQLLSSHNFKDISIEQTHIFKYKIDEYKKHIYEEEEWFKAMEPRMKQILEKNLGWHLLIRARA